MQFLPPRGFVGAALVFSHFRASLSDFYCGAYRGSVAPSSRQREPYLRRLAAGGITVEIRLCCADKRGGRPADLDRGQAPCTRAVYAAGGAIARKAAAAWLPHGYRMATDRARPAALAGGWPPGSAPTTRPSGHRLKTK